MKNKKQEVDKLYKLFCLDYGRNYVHKYDKYQIEYFKSKELSDYYKEDIKQLLGASFTGDTKVLLNSDKTIDEAINEEIKVLNLLNSDKLINDMTEEEIKLLRDTISNYYKLNGAPKIPNIAGLFMEYLFKLDGPGVVTYIKNNIDKDSLSRRILLTSGLSDRASYYSGRGVMLCDLNSTHLESIFNKLLKLDQEYAINFVKLIDDMETLGATEFIESFLNFGNNNFQYDKKNISASNVSLDGLHNEARDMIAFMSIFSTMSRKDDSRQIELSENLKESFMYKIKDKLKDIYPEYYEDKNNCKVRRYTPNGTSEYYYY